MVRAVACEPYSPCSFLLLVPELMEADLWHQRFKVVSKRLFRVEGGPGAGVDCLGEGGDPRQQLGRQRLGAFLCVCVCERGREANNLIESSQLTGRALAAQVRSLDCFPVTRTFYYFAS